MATAATSTRTAGQDERNLTSHSQNYSSLESQRSASSQSQGSDISFDQLHTAGASQDQSQSSSSHDPSEAGSSQNQSEGAAPLSKAQRAQIERNRQRALLAREALARKRAALTQVAAPLEKQSKGSGGPITHKVIDTGGGFLLEDEDTVAPTRPKIIHPPGALLGSSFLECVECCKDFKESYLFEKFSHPVCDGCKDTTDKHRLITRTEAKEKYLLKDCDLDARDPVLPYIVKKNPHNQRWGDMKLYLECQVAEVALTVWGSDEGLDEMKEKRQANRELLKKKKFDKKVKELRRAVRGSMYRKATAGHEHEFGTETYDEAEDNYTKTCVTCGHSVTFEKM